jgi:hypothetical protein
VQVKGVLHNIGGGVKVGRGPSLAKQGQKNIGTRIVKRIAATCLIQQQ